MIELLALLLVNGGSEGTDSPWWHISSKGLRGQRVIHAGPWFSREAANEHFAAKRHRYPKSASVWCASGYMSWDFKRARAVAALSAMKLINDGQDVGEELLAVLADTTFTCMSELERKQFMAWQRQIRQVIKK